MYIRGLFLDAARFDIEKMALEPSELGAPTAPLPYIHILPVEVTQTPHCTPTRLRAPLNSVFVGDRITSSQRRTTSALYTGQPSVQAC